MTPGSKLWVFAVLAMTMGMVVPIRAADHVPFNGWFCATPSGPTTYVNYGRATHVGAFQGTASNVVALPDGTFTGDYTFVAPDGSSISGSWHVFPTGAPVNGYLPFVEPFTITSGTGRFVGATGTGTASGLQELATGNVCTTFTGTISSVGSTRR
jgi:hypothetical protein